MAEIKLHSACQIWQPTESLSTLPETNIWSSLLRCVLSIQKADKKRAESGKALYLEQLRIQPLQGAIFTGPAGNGRHSTAAALAFSLGKDLCHIRVYGSDLDYETPDEAISAMASVAYLANEKSGLCLLLDEPQDCRHSRMIQTRALRIMERAQIPVYVIIVTDKPESVLPGLKQRLMHCHCPKPTQQQRKAWLDQEVSTPVCIHFDDTDTAQLAKQTADFSWQQLQQLAGYLRRKMFWNTTFETKSWPERMRLLENGDITLSDEEIQPYLRSLQDQVEASKPAAASVAMPMQMVAMQPGVMQAEDTSDDADEDITAAADKKLDRSAMQQQMMMHDNPENMDFDQLAGNLGLDFSFMASLEAADATES